MTGSASRPLVVGLWLAFAAPVHALPSTSTGTIMVRYGDIDFKAPDAAAILDRRIGSAIEQLCGTPITGSRDEAEAITACRADAHANAAPKRRLLIGRRTAAN